MRLTRTLAGWILLLLFCCNGANAICWAEGGMSNEDDALSHMLKNLETELAKPLITTAEQGSTGATRMREVVSTLWDIPAAIESLRSGRMDVLMPSLRTEKTTSEPVYYLSEKNSLLHLPDGLMCRFEIRIKERGWAKYPTLMWGHLFMGAKGEILLQVDDFVPTFSLNAHTFPGNLPYSAWVLTAGQFSRYDDFAGGRSLQTRALPKTVGASSLVSLIGAYGPEMSAADYFSYVIERLRNPHIAATDGTENSPSSVLTLDFDDTRLMHMAVGETSAWYMLADVAWDGENLASVNLRILPQVYEVQDEDIAYIATIYSNGQVESQRRVCPTLRIRYPDGVRNIRIGVVHDHKYGAVPSEICVSGEQGEILSMVHLSNFEPLPPDVTFDLDQEHLRSWNPFHDAWELSRHYIEFPPPPEVKKDIERHLKELCAKQDEEKSAFVAKVLTYSYCALQDYDSAVLSIESLLAWLSESGYPTMALMEAEAAAHWSTRHKLEYISAPILNDVICMYQNQIRALDITSNLFRLETQRDYGLSLTLCAVARANQIAVDDIHARSKTYALGFLEELSSSEEKRKRWATEIIRSWQRQDAPFLQSVLSLLNDARNLGEMDEDARGKLAALVDVLTVDAGQSKPFKE